MVQQVMKLRTSFVHFSSNGDAETNLSAHAKYTTLKIK